MWFTVNSADIKKIRNTLDNLYLEKQKMEKGDKAKKNKGKGKAKLKMEGENVSTSLKKNKWISYSFSLIAAIVRLRHRLRK